MMLENRQQVENTRAKLQLLESMYRENSEEPGEMTQARRLTQISLKRLMNQMIEEIVRFESREQSEARGDREASAPAEAPVPTTGATSPTVAHG